MQNQLIMRGFADAQFQLKGQIKILSFNFLASVDTSEHFKVFLTWCEVCRVFYLVSASGVLVRKLFFSVKITLIFIVIVYYCVTINKYI